MIQPTTTNLSFINIMDFNTIKQEFLKRIQFALTREKRQPPARKTRLKILLKITF